jgi:Domain of unknown function (DUF4188)
MPALYPGRYATKIEGPFVVFLIGFRINRLFAVNRWMPVAKAMGPMIEELYANPSLGLLTVHTALQWRGVMMTQYWRSFDQLVAYAQARDAAICRRGRRSTRGLGRMARLGCGMRLTRLRRGSLSACM